MGSTTFVTTAHGKSAKDAFRNAREEVAEKAFDGYSGTIGEKESFKMVYVPKGMSVDEFIDECFEDDNHFANDKWAPAACIDNGDGNYTFFGEASC